MESLSGRFLAVPGSVDLDFWVCALPSLAFAKLTCTCERLFTDLLVKAFVFLEWIFRKEHIPLLYIVPSVQSCGAPGRPHVSSFAPRSTSACLSEALGSFASVHGIHCELGYEQKLSMNGSFIPLASLI